MRLHYVLKITVGILVPVAIAFVIILYSASKMSIPPTVQKTEGSVRKNTVPSMNKEEINSVVKVVATSAPTQSIAITPKPPEAVQESTYQAPPFDLVTDVKFNNMTLEQRCVFNQLEEKFSQYYGGSVSNPNIDPDAWNQQMKEFNQELHERLGQDAADELLK
jgi:hypothetical protein